AQADPNPGAAHPPHRAPSLHAPRDAPPEGAAPDAPPRSAPFGGGSPQQHSVSELLGELQKRYKRTGAATTAYQRTVKKLQEQRRTARRANSALEKSRSALARSRTEAGLLARQQYRDAEA